MAVKTKIQKLEDAFRSGRSLTTEQISNRFGFVRPTSAIRDLRERGLNVVTSYETRKGHTVTTYSLI
jgi:hypothetical protein